MAFDQSTRNRLQKFVSDARGLLSEEFTRQLQNDYGLDPHSGAITPLENLGHLDDTRRETARILRETLAHYLASSPSDGNKEALDRIVREQAFTVLNRLAALRMAESRGILIESVGNGYQSKGFQLYERLAGPGLGETGETYRCYLFSIFDEFALDLKVLFDRFSPQGRLFPRETALLELLGLLNDQELAHLWAEDESIGWVYQYFNSKEERKKMRDESAAPRNSRELAVRNQFFTPRYVVEFLTDNTLGRIWYEMTQGETGLKESCRYLVLRPTEIFLKTGEKAPEQPGGDENLSQEELLKLPVHIQFRPLKDPRTLRMLDPACGSMHFGLYAFDLYEQIYAEAWDLEVRLGKEAFVRESGLRPLTESYQDKESFLQDVPRLIIEHNIHGIDIDPRAAQIAGLSLWLRAQRSWHNQGVKPAVRPRITRSNIVCAEPMPGEKELLREFTASLEVPALGYLVEQVFDKMQLAGEAGSLLKIEEEIRDIIAEAKRQWKAGPKLTQMGLFGEAPAKPEQVELPLDFTGITDERFWEGAEEKLYQALQEYAEVAGEHGYQRRLFAEDAARGFAFIDICRKRYDAVLMNPPFGEASENILPLLQKYESFSDNIVAPFAERFLKICESLGIVLDRALLIRKTHEPFRRLFLERGRNRLHGFANYGWGVLDANVEVAGLVAAGSFTDLSYLLNKEDNLDKLKWLPNDGFVAMPNSVISGDVPDFVINVFAANESLKNSSSCARVGHQWKSERYLRLWWEGSVLGPYVYNGAPFSPYVFVTRNRLACDPISKDIIGEPSTVIRNEKYHYLPGVAYGKRGLHLDAHFLPEKHTFTVEGLACLPTSRDERFLLLAYLNSLPVSALLSFFCGQHKHVGYLNCLPFSSHWRLTPQTIELIDSYVNAKRKLLTYDETSPLFIEIDDILSKKIGLKDKFATYSKSVEWLADLYNKLSTSVNEEVSGWLHFPPNWKLIPELKDIVESLPSYDSSDIFDESEYCSITSYCGRLLGGFVGFVLGRWDIRFAIEETNSPELPDHFSPLPDYPIGMLQNADGLHTGPQDLAASYPLRISWPGILVDDEGHKEDIAARVRDAIEVIWKEKACDIEHEACEILGVRSLRDYFTKPSGFFSDHLKRYSKSRRQAPLYWPLSTPSGSYTLWLYYHRLNDQTLYTCVNDFVEPKLTDVAAELASLRQKGSGRTRDDEKRLEKLQDLEIELQEFRDELLRIARLPWKPNLNDGVQITAAPLWKLFQLPKWKKTLKETWEKLEKGDYDWAHLAYSIWPDRVKKKCVTDKSLAIAHDLEDLYVEPPASAKKKRGKKAVVVEDEEE